MADGEQPGTDRGTPAAAEGQLAEKMVRLAQNEPTTVGSIFQLMLAFGSPRGATPTPAVLTKALENDAARDRQATTRFVAALIVMAVVIVAALVAVVVLVHLLRDHADRILDLIEKIATHAAVGATTAVGGYAVGKQRGRSGRPER